jgi:hypothetical protein
MQCHTVARTINATQQRQPSHKAGTAHVDAHTYAHAQSAQVLIHSVTASGGCAWPGSLVRLQPSTWPHKPGRQLPPPPVNQPLVPGMPAANPWLSLVVCVNIPGDPATLVALASPAAAGHGGQRRCQLSRQRQHRGGNPAAVAANRQRLQAAQPPPPTHSVRWRRSEQSAAGECSCPPGTGSLWGPAAGRTGVAAVAEGWPTGTVGPLALQRT